MLQFIIPGVGGYLTYRLLYRKEIKYKNLINTLPINNTKFKNSNDLAVKYKGYEKTSYSDRIILDISKVLSYEELENEKGYLIEYFYAKNINFKKLKNNLIQMDIIKERINPGEYLQIKQNDHDLYVGVNEENKPQFINMNSFPHMLIGGDTGSGKSRFLMMVLTNLISQCKDIDLYLLQIRKSDLIVFKNCNQTKFIARDLKQTRKLLKYLDNLCKQRDSIIERLTLSKGIYNIEDFNKYSYYNKMKYSYIILDEFSFFNSSGADNKDIKELKKEILGYIKNIVMVGRSVGVFVITSLQKPTASSIPPDIKSQLTCRVAFKLQDNETSIVILGNGGATKLEKRECIVRSLGENICQSQFIDHKIIMNNINREIDNNKEYIQLSLHEEIKEVAAEEVKEVIDVVKEEVKKKTTKRKPKTKEGIIDVGVLKDELNKKV